MERPNGAPACASCRHQRKRCTENCVLARFFPADKTREFQAVHKVFGVSNVIKIVKDLNLEDGKRAVDSLVWEAFCRLKDPVLGPYGEYRRVYEELKFYKRQYQQQIFHHHQLPLTQGGVVGGGGGGGGVVVGGGGLLGWNSNGNNNNKVMNNGIIGGINNNNNNSNNNNSSNGHVMEYSNNSGGVVVDDSRPYMAFSSSLQNISLQNMEKVIRQENGSMNLLPQQHSINGFNEQFY